MLPSMANSTNQWSTDFRSSAVVVDPDLRGDKMDMPVATLQSLLAVHNQSPPHPLMFRIVNRKNGKAVYAGVRQFDAADDHIVISSYLAEALELDQNNNDDDDDAAAETPDALITVQENQLPKGKYARFRPLEAGYDPDDWKPLLERQLNTFTTLTKDSTLTVRGSRTHETFRLLVDKFEPDDTDGICVIDTDLAIDIEALNEEQARETVSKIMAKVNKTAGDTGGSSTGHELNVWNPAQGQVLAGEYVDYELRSWPKEQPLEIELSGFDDDDDEDGYGVDLFVSPKSTRQRALPRSDEHVFGVFECRKGEDGRKRIQLPPTNIELEGAEGLLISVGGYLPPSSSSDSADDKDTSPRVFTLRARSVATEDVEMKDAKENGDPTAGDEERSAEEERCPNCRNWIPKRTMMLHENFCRRNNVSCDQCGRVFQKNSEAWSQHWHCALCNDDDNNDVSGFSTQSHEKHNAIFHSADPLSCPGCSSSQFTTNSLPDLARHRTTLCPAKLILCRFCHLEVPQEGDPINPSPEIVFSGMTAHEFADGGRTTECHRCDRIVKMRDLETHLLWHDRLKEDRPKPAVCRNSGCGRTLFGVGKKGAVFYDASSAGGSNSNSTMYGAAALGLCETCFAPLFAQGHDPEGKAMRRRVERRYLTQMSRGCGKSWCGNVEWCKTGRSNAGPGMLPAKPTGLKELVPLVKPLVDAVFSKEEGSKEKAHFCVDETSAQRRVVADMLADEGEWELEWCVAAAQAEGPDMERARAWLVDWAPRRAASASGAA